MAVTYVVARIDRGYQQCGACGGVGSISKTIRGETFKKQCTAYGCQNGRILKEHETKVDLMDALRELGLIQQRAS